MSLSKVVQSLIKRSKYTFRLNNITYQRLVSNKTPPDFHYLEEMSYDLLFEARRIAEINSQILFEKGIFYTQIFQALQTLEAEGVPMFPKRPDKERFIKFLKELHKFFQHVILLKHKEGITNVLLEEIFKSQIENIIKSVEEM